MSKRHEPAPRTADRVAEHPWRELARRVAPREWRHVVIAFVMGIGWSVAAVGVPFVAGRAVDRIGDGARAADLVWIGAAVLGLAVLKSGSLRVRKYLTFTSSARTASGVRQSLHRRLHGVPALRLEELGTGEVLATVGDDTEYIEQFGVILQVLFNNFVWTALIVGLLFANDVPLALAALLPLPLVLVLSLRFLRALEQENAHLRSESVGLIAAVADTVAGMNVIKGLGLEPRAAHRLAIGTERARAAADAVGKVRARHTSLIEFVPTLSIAIVLLFGVLRVDAGAMSIGDLAAFNAYVVMAIWPLRSTAMAVVGAARARLAIIRVAELESATGARDTGAAAKAPTRVTASGGAVPVELRDVSFGYEGDRKVLRGVDLALAPGEVVAVTGATGAGKTTLLRLISGEVSPWEGEVRVAGVDPAAATPEQRAATVSVVAKRDFLFARSLRENLHFARPGAVQDELEEAAELAVLDEVVADLDEGWETGLGERGSRLSGGQRQRASLARGLLSGAGVLLLDDVTSALDPVTRAHVIRAIPRIRQGRTVVIVTAQPALAAAADRVLVLNDGRLVEMVAAGGELCGGPA